MAPFQISSIHALELVHHVFHGGLMLNASEKDEIYAEFTVVPLKEEDQEEKNQEKLLSVRVNVSVLPNGNRGYEPVSVDFLHVLTDQEVEPFYSFVVCHMSEDELLYILQQCEEFMDGNFTHSLSTFIDYTSNTLTVLQDPEKGQGKVLFLEFSHQSGYCSIGGELMYEVRTEPGGDVDLHTESNMLIALKRAPSF